jgi:hypothetical protein
MDPGEATAVILKLFQRDSKGIATALTEVEMVLIAAVNQYMQ